MPRETVVRSTTKTDLPWLVIKAREIDWGVFIDAVLVGAAQVGNRYTALVYDDQSGQAENGSTVVTPPLVLLASQGMFKMLRSVSGNDHYVIASEQ